jgi:iron complex transport system substrate-binding protein
LVLGKALNKEQQAKLLKDKLTEQLQLAREKAESKSPKRTLVVVQSEIDGEAIAFAVLAGKDSIYDEVIEASGGVNPVTGKIAYPRISAEGIISLEPHVVLVLSPDSVGDSQDDSKLVGAWNNMFTKLGHSRARVHIVKQDFAISPGPRIVQMVELFATLIGESEAWSDA